MLSLLRQAGKFIYDFDRDVTDLSERLEKAEKTIARLATEASDLQNWLLAEKANSDRLKADNERLSRLLAETRRT